MVFVRGLNRVRMKKPSPGSCLGGLGRRGDGTVPIGAALTTTTRRTFTAFIAWTIALVPSEALSRRVSLRTELASELPAVLGDRVQLHQVMINLAINGMDAMASVTDRPRELLIRSQRESDQVLVTVQDCGTGIDPDSMDRIFEAFFTTKSSGMGMGLSISRSIVEAHRGRLWATPNAPHGAIFHFSLPVGPVLSEN